MKIAYFLDIPKGFGGACNLLLQQAVLMSELYEVLIVMPCDEEGNYNQEYVKRCGWYNLSYANIPYSTAINFCNVDFDGALECAKDIEALIKKEKITFLHSAQLNIAVEYVARKLKIPHLMDIYQLREEEFEVCPGDIYPHYHLCDSQLYAERWSRRLGIQSRCVRPIGVLDKIQKKEVYQKDSVNILMLGNVCTRKNQLGAIKAIELCVDKFNMTLTIAGAIESEYARQCVNYVKEHQLEERIVFMGFVSDISPLLIKNDCLLCASIDESFPSSIVEALTYDLTIISTPVAGVPEVFEDKNNAFISKDFSVESICESLMECANSYKTGDIHIIHRNAEITWEDNFGRKKVREQIHSYYKEICKNPYTDIQAFCSISEEVKQTNKLLFHIYSEYEGMKRRSLYHTTLRKRLRNGKMYIWGAGKLGEVSLKILSIICPDIEILSFVDKNKEGSYYEIPITKPENMIIDETLLYGISFVKGREDAIWYLESKGLTLNKQIWILP